MYILDNSTLPDVSYADIFSLSVVCLLSLLMFILLTKYTVNIFPKLGGKFNLIFEDRIIKIYNVAWQNFTLPMQSFLCM